MSTVVSIVEGDSEVGALPLLLRRVAQWLSPGVYVNVPAPIRVRKDQFLNRPAIFEKQLRLAALKCVQPGWILILLDADDDCPRLRAEEILARAQLLLPDRRVSVVLANREYEAWFIAAAQSLNGKRGLALGREPAPDAEMVRGAKEWLSAHIPNSKYHEVTDQPAFSALMDLPTAFEHSRSFRKLCSEWTRQTMLSETGIDA